MPKYTDAQLDRARQTNLELLLRGRGEKLVRSGGEWRWVYRDGVGEHDSVTVKGGEWYDHKRDIGGDAIGFLQEFMGMDFKEAISVLLNGEQGEELYQQTSAAPVQPKTFTLPERNGNMRRLYAYLTKTRFLCTDIITHFVRAGSLYEDVRHNAVFLGLDEQGAARAGQIKGTLTVGKSYRKTICGSDARYGFHHKGASGRLYVYEAPIDMLSYITMHQKDWQEHSYIALDGLSPKALYHFIDRNKSVREICLCLDNDPAGIEAAGKFSDELRERGCRNIERLCSVHKDWNETLKSRNGVTPIPAQSHPKIEAYREIVSHLSVLKTGKYADALDFSHITANLRRAVERREYLRTATLCALAVKSLGGGDMLHRIANSYKPYTDKGKLKSHADELRKCAAALCRSPGVDELTALADAAIRAEVYMRIDYQADLERQATFVLVRDEPGHISAFEMSM